MAVSGFNSAYPKLYLISHALSAAFSKYSDVYSKYGVFAKFTAIESEMSHSTVFLATDIFIVKSDLINRETEVVI